MTIMILKLVTGEELISDVTPGPTYTLKKPCMLQLVPSRSNPEQPMMALMPYAAYTESHTVNIPKEFILWIESPIKELYNQYNNAFGSGIQLAGL